jgi:hypothetical protein
MANQSTAETNRSPQETQRDILYALTEPGDGRPLWTVEELALELDEPFVVDHVNALRAAGLIHRTSDGFIFATRAAARHIELTGRVT